MSTANRGKVAHGGTKSKSNPRSKSGGGQGHEGGGEGGHKKNMANKLGMHAAGQREKKKETQLRLQSKMRVTQLTRQLQKAEDDLRDYRDPSAVAAAARHIKKNKKRKSNLKGAARSWDSQQPSPHGCGRKCFEVS